MVGQGGLGSAEVTKIVMVIEYEGTRYCGFQLQANVLTVQGELERAIGSLTGERVRVLAASRTDSGVHAKGQVVGFRTGSRLAPETFVSGLNYYLPEDISVRAAFGVANGFDVRRDAVRREYRYCILNRATRSPIVRRLACFVPRPLDIEAMNQACQVLVGWHDFRSFVTCGLGERSPVRTVHKAAVRREGEFVTFDMAADSFLPHQVRNTVGPLIRVGLGKMSGEDFWRMARAGQPGLAVPAAPPWGLYLMKVEYPMPLGSEDEDL